MKLRPLGKTDVMVTPIGLGCWQFSQRASLPGKFWPTLPADAMRAIIKAALDGGINWFDTAELYGNGASEAALADGLRAAGVKPGEAVVATKWRPLWRSAGHLVSSIGERQRHLAEYPIDLHQIHFRASFSSIRAEARALATLVRQGHVKAVGVSNYNARQMRAMHRELHALGIPLASNQVEYSLLKRDIERNGVLETAKELGITIIAYSPLAQGMLTAKFHDNPALVQSAGLRRYFNPGFRAAQIQRSRPLIEALKRIARGHGVTPGEVALNWLVHYHGDTVVAIPGATRAAQASDNARVMSFTLSHEEMQEVDALSR
jgi:aryl-alcohol dehydrogenase-like predicted oxidoreductase